MGQINYGAKYLSGIRPKGIKTKREKDVGAKDLGAIYRMPFLLIPDLSIECVECLLELSG